MTGKTPKKWNIGIFAPRNFSEIEILESVFSEKTDIISHIFTNDTDGAQVIFSFCSKYGIPYTVFPISNLSGSVLASNSRIIQKSEYIILLEDGNSSNSKNVVQQCSDANKKVKIVNFTGISDRDKIIKKVNAIESHIRKAQFNESSEPALEEILKEVNKLKNVLKI